MNKFVMLGLVAALVLPVTAQAQSAGEMRRDRRDVQEERADLRDAQMRGNRNDIREERHDLRDARQELREDRRDRRDRRDAYVAPYRDWRYSSLRNGSQLRSGFYNQSYAVRDLGRYNLRPVARNQRWIRYGDDLVLVNVRNGRVLQVLRNRY